MNRVLGYLLLNPLRQQPWRPRLRPFVLLAVCRWLAYQIRFDFNVPAQYQEQIDRHWFLVLSIELSLLAWFRQFSIMTRYFNVLDIHRLAMPLALGALAGCRVAYTRLQERYFAGKTGLRPKIQNVAIVGAGDVGSSLVMETERRPAAGGPVTVTHPDMQRYFMTIPEAVGLVLQSCAQGAGGEIFVLDMGQPEKIAQLARQMIELSGLKPGVDIEMQLVGLRPGEKLFEELKCVGENYRPTRHPRIMSFVHPAESLDRVRLALRRLEAEVHSLDAAGIKLRIRHLVPGYSPCLEPDRAASAPASAARSPARQGTPRSGPPRRCPRGAAAAFGWLPAATPQPSEPGRFGRADPVPERVGGKGLRGIPGCCQG